MPRLQPTLADYVVIAVNPVLIMGLVGSLVYFLVEIFYGGAYPDRLLFCLSSFVFAIVLVSRISMEEGFERAAPFGFALAVVVGIALNKFVEYHSAAAESFGWIINWSLMALTWWCAHKLTWDCTNIDDRAEASGRGLLETAGIESAMAEPAAAETASENDPHEPPAEPENLPAAVALSQSSWRRLLDRPRRPHTPGVWIVYFSLASLPIFGIGQAFIPAESAGRRRYAFCLLCVYVGCGLSLLLTTSFLSLRRYLRQRRLEMPAVMTGNWLAIGGVMVLGLLLFSALLPRPAPEYAISALPSFATSEKHDASSASVGSEGVRDSQAGPDRGVDHSPDQPGGQTDQAPGADTHQTTTGPGGNTPGKSGSAAGQKGSSGQTSGGQSSGGQSTSGQSSADQQSSGQSPAGAESKSSEQSSGKSAQPPAANSGQPNAPPPGEKSAAQNPGAQNPSPQNPSGQAPAPDSPAKPPAMQSAEKQAAEKPAGQQPPAPGQTSTPPANASQPTTPPPTPSATQPPPTPASPPPAVPQAPSLPALSSLLSGFGSLLKIVFYAALVLAVCFGAWVYRDDLARMIAGWLGFWRSLFGGRRDIGPSAAEVAFHEQQLQWSFTDFADPFASGAAARSAPAEVVKYTFAALEVWGREQGLERGLDQTPHEFVALLSTKHPSLRADSLALANLYSRAVYSQAALAPAAVANLAQLWRLMNSARPVQSVMPE